MNPDERIKHLIQAIYGVFESPNEVDVNLEPANVVDGLFAIARAINNLAKAIKENE